MKFLEPGHLRSGHQVRSSNPTPNIFKSMTAKARTARAYGETRQELRKIQDKTRARARVELTQGAIRDCRWAGRPVQSLGEVWQSQRNHGEVAAYKKSEQRSYTPDAN